MCTAPLSAQYEPATGGEPALASALLRILLADDAGVLLLLGVVMPQHILLDACAQLAFLWNLRQQNMEVCQTPFVRSTARSSHMHFLNDMSVRALPGHSPVETALRSHHIALW